MIRLWASASRRPDFRVPAADARWGVTGWRCTWLLAAIIVMAVGVSGGCRERSARPETPGGRTPGQGPSAPSATASLPSGSPPAPARRPSSVSLEQIGLVHKDLPMDLDDHTWNTEHLNDTAGRQLKELAKRLSHPEELTEEALADLATADCQTTALRPVSPEDVFTDGPFRVQRMTGPATGGGRGPGALRNALLAAVRPEGAESIAVQFKIFRVTPSEAEPETMVRVEVVRRDPSTASQVVAQWRCGWSVEGQDVPPRLARVTLVSHEESTVRSATPAFAEATESLLGTEPVWRDQLSFGLDHWLERIEQDQAFGPSGWEGVAMGDADGDGREDLYVCQPGGLPNRLLLQQPDGTLRDGSAAAGVDWWDQTQSALFVDFDNDGDQDLAIAMIWGLVFMANDGRGTFEVRHVQLIPEGMPYALAASDVDADGDVDLYVGCYGRRSTAVDQRFLARPIPYHDASNGSRNILFRNDQGWRFTDVTRAVGLDENNRRFTFAAAWEDADGDGDPDLYVANDFGRNNLYRMESPSEEARRTDPLPMPRFRDVAAEAGVEDISAGMSASWGDANNDGRPDIYVSNMWSSAGNRIAYQRRFREGADEASLAQFQRHSRGNSLFLNAGDGTFTDVSEPAGVTMGRWAWGSRFVDLNSDGSEDLLVANGYITQPDPGDL